MCCEDDDGNDEEEEEDDDEDEEEAAAENELEDNENMKSGDATTSMDVTLPDAADANSAAVAPEIVDEKFLALQEMIEMHGLNTLYPPLDGTAFYGTICRINHSCDPNVRVTYVNSESYGLQAHLLALRPINIGEELVQSYIDQFESFTERQKALKDYGFSCSCSKCLTDMASM